MGEEMKFVRPKKLELQVERLDGTMMHLECEQITQDMVRRIGDAADKKAHTALYEQMAVFFGGKKEDYSGIDARVVTQVIQWMTAQMRDPT